MKKLLIALCLVTGVSTVFAGTSNKTGFKFGASGYYVYNKPTDGSALFIRSHDIGWNGFVGFRFNDFLGLRVGYYAIRDSSYKGQDLMGYGPKNYKTKAFDAAVNINLPLGYCTDVTLILGAATVDVDAHELDTTKLMPEIGVAMRFQHNRFFATEWTATHMHHNDSVNDINMVSLGVAFTLPV